ncbi:MAG TPA: MBL fold metallo-hydrolase [Cellvibrionaceae bacterium]|nr:MBL fold metallo-hydrolase [Cellvibrionaceae bacterium]
MQFRIIPVTPYQQNCSLIWDPACMEGALVDPGGEPERLLAQVQQLGVNLRMIVLTHGHLDHVGATAELAIQLNIPIVGPHPDDQFWLDDLDGQARWMGFKPVEHFTPNRWLHEGDKVRVGGCELEVLHIPGHTPGHVVLVHRPSQLAWVGDVLFAGSIGRSDFPRGDHDLLVRGIAEKLWPLGDDVRFIPGHGPMSSFGHERRTNPFVADKQFG